MLRAVGNLLPASPNTSLSHLFARSFTVRRTSILACVAVCSVSVCSFAVAGEGGGVAEPSYVDNVVIVRDTWGVPHIRGKTDADVAFGLAYAHAEDDWPIIQGTIIAAKGRLAELNGKEGALNDFFIKLLKVREFVDEKYETDLSPDFQRICEAYAAGLTYYAALHPEEVKNKFLPYTGKDVVAGFVQKVPMFFGLDGVLKKLEKGPEAFESQAALAPELQKDFAGIGSNTMGVNGPRSADGKTRLAINSHQPWEGPVTWYEAHLHSDEGWDTIGGLFPGTPMILHGHNQHLGWAFTVNKPDLVDVYRLEINPENEYQYKLDGEWKDLDRKKVTLKVKVGPAALPVTRELLYSVHGPAMKFDHGTYAVRIAGWGDIRAGEQYFRLNKARNFDEWIGAMKKRWIPSLNVGYGDKDGNIYYLYNGLIPKRDESFEWGGLLPGDTSRAIWTEYIPFESLPQVKNPKSGFFQNANSTPFQTTTGPDCPEAKDFSVTLGIETHMTDRSKRIMELLSADESITGQEFYDYKFDQTYPKGSVIAARLEPLLTESVPPGSGLEEAVNVLKKWNWNTNAANKQACLAIRTNYEFVKAKYFGEPTPDPWAALKVAADHLQKDFGSLEVPLGELQRIRRGKTDLPIGGGPDAFNSVHSKMSDDGRLVGLVGDSYVLIVTFDETGVARSQAIHQYGNVNRPDSPHYDDQAKLFVKRELRDSFLTAEDILANTEVAYRPGREIKVEPKPEPKNGPADGTAGQ
jgi:penicillin amidase/acyl-homoserine-lactone acylase